MVNDAFTGSTVVGNNASACAHYLLTNRQPQGLTIRDWGDVAHFPSKCSLQ